jgi:hypothetical protein
MEIKLINKMLNQIGVRLQISESKYNKLVEHYTALCNHIDSKHILSEKSGIIYQQGSFAIDTVIKPLKGEEFDVDMVAQFNQLWIPGLQVTDFYDKLTTIFEVPMYEDKLEQYKNCVRIKYQGDYHFDIMPVLPIDNLDSKHLKTVDKKRSKWVDRSPLLYSAWFNKQSSLIEKNNVKFNNYLGKSYIFFEDMEKVPLKKPEEYHIKPTLNRVIQLVKRARDIFFHDVDECIPQSIVLTTMIAREYSGEIDLISALIDASNIMYGLACSKKQFDIVNPVNDDERFTDKWKLEPEFYINFQNFSFWFKYKVSNLMSDNKKIVLRTIEDLFGESIKSSLLNDDILEDYWSSIKSNQKPEYENEEIIEDKFKLNLKDVADIDCNVIQDGFRPSRLRKLRFLNTNKKLDFFIDNIEVIEPYEIYWKVRNVGSVAENKNQIRGRIFKGQNNLNENSNFSGPHFVECYIVKNNEVVAIDRISVNIEGDYY